MVEQQHPLLAVKHLKEFVGTSHNFPVQQHFLTGSFAWSAAFDFFLWGHLKSSVSNICARLAQLQTENF
jgi:hypothetical protein